ncbi:MAG: cold shock domain-containing protein [Chloroflexi bacterium]|nr:cold shock domain-containing protein [Ardenticatenaceae bacterium]MBL1127197.1 cold shock domain-containing protein [Chloroflexota bacterium]NOG33258.1 cold shock domain-containing protein [Chloroflexota bacterium]
MNYKDQWATNENGEQFLFTVEMQRRLDQAGLPIEPASLSQLTERVAVRPSYSPPPSRQQSHDRDDDAGTTFAEPLTIQIDPQTGKYLGRLKWYNVKKGYGFIVRGAGEEIFFHKSSTVGEPEELQEGQWVLYDVEETRKGLEATEIEPYQGDNSLLA